MLHYILPEINKNIAIATNNSEYFCITESWVMRKKSKIKMFTSVQKMSTKHDNICDEFIKKFVNI